jgi:hypothetical protein
MSTFRGNMGTAKVKHDTTGTNWRAIKVNMGAVEVNTSAAKEMWERSESMWAWFKRERKPVKRTWTWFENGNSARISVNKTG